MKLKKLISATLMLALMTTAAACASGDTSGGGASSAPAAAQTEASQAAQAAETAATEAAAAATEAATQAEAPAVTFDHDITMIVPWAAGGGTDTVARKLVENSEKYLGVKINVENITGGSGAVGLAELLTAAPDGYTLAVLPVELSFLKEQGVYTFDFNDFTQICNINTDPAALTVSASSDFQSVADLVEYAQANPGALKVGHSGTGFLWHLAGGLFANAAGIDITYVPYDGSATGNAALLGGEIDAVTFSGAEEVALEASGDLRVLATFSDERMSVFEGVPTLKEEGYDVVLSTFRGIGGPAGMDPEVVAVLSEAFGKMSEEPSFIEAMDGLGLGIQYLDTEEYKALCDATAADMKSVCELLGLSQ